VGPTDADPIFPQSNFTEGLAIDYKYFIQEDIEPRFAFGYGLTYTNFSYSDLQISLNSSADTSLLPYDRLQNSSLQAPEGGLASLYDNIATVTVTVENIGNFTAAEVAQLYVGVPNGLPKVLRGFDKQTIGVGENVTYSFPLRRRDLSMWDTVQQQWILQSGNYSIMVGKSVLDIQLTGTLNI
jgi:beta-glucosidase